MSRSGKTTTLNSLRPFFFSGKWEVFSMDDISDEECTEISEILKKYVEENYSFDPESIKEEVYATVYKIRELLSEDKNVLCDMVICGDGQDETDITYHFLLNYLKDFNVYLIFVTAPLETIFNRVLRINREVKSATSTDPDKSQDELRRPVGILIQAGNMLRPRSLSVLSIVTTPKSSVSECSDFSSSPKTLMSCLSPCSPLGEEHTRCLTVSRGSISRMCASPDIFEKAEISRQRYERERLCWSVSQSFGFPSEAKETDITTLWPSLSPHLIINTEEHSPEECAEQVINFIRSTHPELL
jgi:hypothetical protein